ncbi:unnamed protein product [Cunninghamella blakesleeana]
MVSVSDDYCQNCFRQTSQEDHNNSKSNNNNKMDTTLVYPNIPPTPLQRCSKCKAAYFCHQDCFKAAWLSYHQYICGDDDIRHCDEELLERVILNIIRYKNYINGHTNYYSIIEQSSLNHQNNNINNNNNNNNINRKHHTKKTHYRHHKQQSMKESIHITMEAFSLLQDHLNHQPHHIINQFSEIAINVLNRPYIQEEAIKHNITLEDVIRMQSLFQCNGISIQDDHLFVVGEGIYPVASFFNHSCRPNAAIIFDGALLTVHAIEPIAPNEEITIAYIDIGRSRGYRQRILRDRYFFNCDCVRCNDHGWLRLLDKMVGENENDEDEDISDIHRINNNNYYYNNNSNNSNNNRKLSLSFFSASPTTHPIGNSFGRRKKIDQFENLKKHIQHWDLLSLSRQYNRLQNIHPDPTKPLTLGTFTHHMLQFFTPYIWSINNHHLQYTNLISPSSSTDKTTPLFSECINMNTFSVLSRLPPTPNSSPPIFSNNTLLSDEEDDEDDDEDDEDDDDNYVFFDDPTPENAQPPIQPTYKAILTKAMETCLSFPQPHYQQQQQQQQSQLLLLPSTTFMNGMTSIPVFRISTLISVNRLFYEAMTNQDWEFAAKCGLYILIQYCFLYPAYHPIVAHHLIMMAKTGWNFIVQGNITEKVYARGVWRWIILAKETCKVAFGVNGCLYKETLHLEWLFKREQQSVLYPTTITC